MDWSTPKISDELRSTQLPYEVGPPQARSRSTADTECTFLFNPYPTRVPFADVED